LCHTAVATPGLIRSWYHCTKLVLVPYHHVDYRIPAVTCCLSVYDIRRVPPDPHPIPKCIFSCNDEVEQHRTTRPNYLPHHAPHTQHYSAQDMAMLAAKSPYPAPSMSGGASQSSAQYSSSHSNYRSHAANTRADQSMFASPTESEFSEIYDAPDAIR
jgi:hypothetical protein